MDTYLLLNPSLPDPLKTPPFFSQWAKLQNFFETRAERTGKTPTKEMMTVKLEKVLAV